MNLGSLSRGSRIITTVLQVLLNRMVHGLNLATSVLSPRIHSQLWPDRVQIEQGISLDTIDLLEQWGHTIQRSGRWARPTVWKCSPKAAAWG